MFDTLTAPRLPENQILALLPPEELDRFRRYLQPVDLPQGQVLYEAGVPFDEVYFVEQGMGSVVSIMENGASIEVGTIGNEGGVGLALFLGVSVSVPETLVQIPGDARRMPADAFQSAVLQLPRFRESSRDARTRS